jgi:hypothetical protein
LELRSKIKQHKINNTISVNAHRFKPSAICHLSPNKTAYLEKLTVVRPIQKLYLSFRKLPFHCRMIRILSQLDPIPLSILVTKRFNIIFPLMFKGGHAAGGAVG